MRAKIEEILTGIYGDVARGSVTESAKPEFGHYASNLAMRLAKDEKKNPLDLARELGEKATTAAPGGFFEKVETVPPGFVNFWLSPAAVHLGFAEMREAGLRFGGSEAGAGKKVIVEHSSLNIAKPIHVGHLRNASIGDALANIHEELGYEVIRWDYLGDWGTQFGKLIAAYKLWGKKEDVERAPIETLNGLYVRFHEELKNDPVLEDRGREEFRKIEEGDRENRELWEWFKKESLAQFHKTYGELGIVFDVEIGESFFENKMKPVVETLTAKKIAEESEGALVVKLDAEKLPPALIRKSDGTSLYLTRDIANLEYRLAEYNPARILYVVGNEQSLHFSQLFAIAAKLGLGGNTELAHVKYGLVLDEGGKKFSTREGRGVTLEEILGKAKDLARKIVEEKNPGLSSQEKEEISHLVATGALKHASLKENRNSDIVFDWHRMLDFSGDSGPYLQYTHARLRSILRKTEEDWQKADAAHLSEELDLALMRKLFSFPDAVQAAGESLAPNLLVNYLYELANLANRFYEAVPILKDGNSDRRPARLMLVEQTAAVLQKGLNLLGIQAPEKI